MKTADQVQVATAVMAQHGRTFRLALRLLPPSARGDIALLYAFCRRMDDLADEHGAGEGEARQRQLEQVVAVLRDDPCGPGAVAVGWPSTLEQRHPGMAQVASALISALSKDTGTRYIASEDELLDYAFGVAGTVGLMMCPLLGAPAQASRAAAHLGIAMQLTNIARDVGGDFQAGRIYLPRSWICPAAVRAALSGGDPRDLCEATWRLLRLAECFYASATAGMSLLPSRSRLGVLAAACCYREIGVRVGANPAVSWRRRTTVSTARKAALVASAMAATARGRSLSPGPRAAPPQVALCEQSLEQWNGTGAHA